MPATTPLIAVVTALLAAAPLGAQVNIERLRTGDTTVGWGGEAALGLTLRTGNVRLFRLDPSGRVDYAEADLSTFLIVRGDIGIQGGRRYSNAGLVHLRAGRRRGRVSPEGFVQANYDRSQKLLFRSLIGGGLRLRLAALPRGGLWLGTAAMYEHERLDLDTTALHPAETGEVRWSSYLSARTSNERGAAFVTTVYAQPAVSDFGDTRLLMESTAAAPVTGSLLLTVTFWTRLDTEPPDGVRRLDTELRSGVAFTF